MQVFSEFSELEVLAFALVMIRVSSFMVSWPVFGTSNVPISVKILVSLSISLMLLPVIGWKTMNAAVISDQIVWLAIKEGCIGVMMGFLCRMFFFAVSIGGQLIGTSMGLANAQLFNPALGGSGTPVEQFQIALATLFFLGINGHHVFLTGLAESFQIIPVTKATINVQSFVHFGEIVQEIIIIGIKISAPVLIALFFINVAMGIIGRAVPQVNVLVTGMPVNILVGLVILIVSIPMMIGEMRDLLDVMSQHLFWMMKTV